MRVRHITASANVSSHGTLLDPHAVRHGVIVAGRIAALGAPIDPSTHLNADFPEHGLEQCVVADSLEIGSAVRLNGDGIQTAWAVDDEYRSLGPVDQHARLQQWRVALASRRLSR